MDPPCMRLDDRLNLCQPETGTAGFGGHEGLENTISDRDRDAGAGIAERDERRTVDLLAADTDTPAIRHGLDRVYYDIEKRLIDLVGIADHPQTRRPAVDLERDVMLGELGAGDIGEPLDQLIDHHCYLVQLARPDEIKDVAHQVLDPVDLIADVAEDTLLRRAFRNAPVDELTRCLDDTQRVADLVRKHGGSFAERRKLLALAHLRF